MSPCDIRACHQEWRPCWAIVAVACSSLLYVDAAAKEPLRPKTAANFKDSSTAKNETTTTTTGDKSSQTTTTANETETTTTTSYVEACSPGQELRPTFGGSTCRECKLGFFKPETGSGECLVCPLGSTTSFDGAIAIDQCLCNSTSYSDGNTTKFSCIQCPPNSVVGLQGTSINSCSCPQGYIRVPENGDLEKCREPLPCDVQARLRMLNITGPSQSELHLGTCGNITWLEHQSACNLFCSPGTAPQARSNLVEAIDMSIYCEDGEIIKSPAVGTWCSRDAYVVPSLVFLGTVAVAALLAGAFIERRQHRWAEECAQALRFKHLAKSRDAERRNRAPSSGGPESLASSRAFR